MPSELRTVLSIGRIHENCKHLILRLLSGSDLHGDYEPWSTCSHQGWKFLRHGSRLRTDDRSRRSPPTDGRRRDSRHLARWLAEIAWFPWPKGIARYGRQDKFARAAWLARRTRGNWGEGTARGFGEARSERAQRPSGTAPPRGCVGAGRDALRRRLPTIEWASETDRQNVART